MYIVNNDTDKEPGDGCHGYLRVIVVPIRATPCISGGEKEMSGLPGEYIHLSYQ